MDRTILHCDCNGFYASVECSLDPKLREVPMAVAGNPENRHGIILAKNELAKKYNILTAETINSAKRKCPELVIVPPHHSVYKEFSVQINEIYQRFTDLVEPFSIDESWLDITGSRRLFGDGVSIANELRTIVKNETGVTISVGVSFNKIFAKLGSDYKKPDATTVISRKNYKEILYPMPIESMIFVGERTAETLKGLGIQTIGELAAFDKNRLISRLGKAGETLHKYACGLDDEPVKSIYDEQTVKSIGNSNTFSEDIRGEESYREKIIPLARSVAERLRKKSLKCNTVQVTVKTPEFKVIQRQKKTDYPLCTARELTNISMEILHSSWNMSQPVRMLAMTVSGLIDESAVSEQITLFEDNTKSLKKQEKLEKTLDFLKEKFGSEKIDFGRK